MTSPRRLPVPWDACTRSASPAPPHAPPLAPPLAPAAARIFAITCALSVALTSALTGIACSAAGGEAGPARDRWRHATEHLAPNASALDPAAGLPELLQRAEQTNPELIAAGHRWKAALERVPQAAAFPDPNVQFGYFLEEVQTRTGPMQWRVGISQPLPWLDRLDSATSATLAEADAAGASFERSRLGLLAEVRDAWAELAWAGEATRITREHRGWLLSWEEAARRRYATGLGTEADVLRAQVELGKMDDRVRSLEDLHRPIRARLNALLDRPAAAELPEATFATATALPFDDEDLAAWILETSPELGMLDARVGAAEARLEVARTEGRPNPSIGLDFTRIGKGGDDALAVTAGLSIPLQRSRVRAAVAEAEAVFSATQAERNGAVNRLRAQIELLLYKARDAERRLGLYRDTLLPKGQESVQTVTVGYQAGEATFLELVDAERVLLEFQLAVARARADHAQSLAALQALTSEALFPETGP